MYGRATIVLSGGTPHALTIPSGALAGDAENGNATVRVVRNGHAEFMPIRIGKDNGVEVEVLSGLKPDDSIVLRANAPLDNGTPVTVSSSEKNAEHAH